jgi:hypothetical protein
MRHMPQHETAEWMGCTVEEMTASHDVIHSELTKWAGVDSQSLRIAAGDILDAEEHRLAWLEEAAVLNVQRWLVALGRIG